MQRSEKLVSYWSKIIIFREGNFHFTCVFLQVNCVLLFLQVKELEQSRLSNFEKLKNGVSNYLRFKAKSLYKFVISLAFCHDF